MEASAGRSFSTLAWIGCWIGLVVLGIVWTTGSYYIDTTVTVVALLAMILSSAVGGSIATSGGAVRTFQFFSAEELISSC